MEKHITAPLKESDIKDLKAGDYVYITGMIYTARDAAHKRMYETIGEHKELPIKMQDTVIYYMGPSPARQGRPMIGKGKRSQAVKDAIVRNKAVYFAAIGGAGALLSQRIKSSEVIAYDDLGTEAIRRLEVEDFPVIVVIDSEGTDLYEQAAKKYCK